jgi:hypothetical protein
LFHRAADNWKNLKELEKAVKVYWSAKDRLPPRVWPISFQCTKASFFIYYIPEMKEKK